MTNKSKKTTFIKLEERKKGKIGLSAYIQYFNSMTNLYLFSIPILVSLIISSSVDSLYRYFISAWVDGCDGTLCIGNSIPALIRKFFYEKSAYSISLFLFVFCLGAIFARAFNWMLLIGFLENGARNLHSQMVTSFANVRISFFDENPTGRLVRRFSGDYFQIKDDLPQLLSDILSSLFELLIIFIIVMFQAPFIIISILPCFLMYFKVQGVFKPASREIQRFLKIIETPMWSL